MVDGLSFFNHQILAPSIGCMASKIPSPTKKQMNCVLKFIEKNRAPLEGVELALLDHFQLDLSEMESEAKELAQVPLGCKKLFFCLKSVVHKGEMVKEIQTLFFLVFLVISKGLISDKTLPNLFYA